MSRIVKYATSASLEFAKAYKLTAGTLERLSSQMWFIIGKPSLGYIQQLNKKAFLVEPSLNLVKH